MDTSYATASPQLPVVSSSAYVNGSASGPSRHLGTVPSIDLTGDSDDDAGDRSEGRAGAGGQEGAQASITSPSRKELGPSHSSPHSVANGSHPRDTVQMTDSSFAPPATYGGTGHRNLPVPGTNGFSTHHSLTQPHPSRMYPDLSPRNTWAPSISAAGPSMSQPRVGGSNGFGITTNGFSAGSNGAGISSASAIDLTRANLPSPPRVSEKKPICIGAIQSRVIMIYKCPVAIVGAPPPPDAKERFMTVSYLGAEMLKVKLKLRPAGALLRRDEPRAPPKSDVIQVLTPGLSCYIGDLEPHLADVLLPHISRGLLRLEGFVQRLQPESQSFDMRISVLLFTLPSNINYIAQSLLSNNQYLLDPVPPYDPSRHADLPEYHNAHGSDDQAMRTWLAQRRSAAGLPEGMPMGYMDKAKQVEVQRKQMDEVFKSLDNGGQLEQSDPGLLIKTELFPHQRRALTFLLQREQDWSSLKAARKAADKKMRRGKGEVEASVDGDAEGDPEVQKGKAKDRSRSLWEGKQDAKGRTRIWKNKVTGQEIKTKKGEKPNDGKGAILADDMGLGKTLSVVSLIATTRKASQKWAKLKLEQVSPGSDDEQATGSGIKASEMRTKVFGMPDPDSDNENGLKGKKRKREETAHKCPLQRRSRISQRSKATLLVCPMSTITNWEDQIKEHWDGPVEIVGGAAGVMPPKKIEKKWKPPKKEDESDSDAEGIFDTLRVYIYHGPSRRPDPEFIATFDIVITSYNTLALEFTKQTSTGGDATPNTANETAANSSDEGDNAGPLGDTAINSRAVKPEVEAEIKAAEVADALRNTKKKGKGVKRAGPEQTSPLQAIDWFRIVLDEAHYIKSSSTVASLASCDLEADRRICLTGTPIQNKIEDVWALFKFLRVSPVDEKECFTEYISRPCKYGEQIGVARLQLVMRCCTLRRTKDSMAEDGRRILNLPPRKEEQLWMDLREDEREAYDARATAVRQRVGELQANNELGKNYANVLQEVLRLRQICDHVDLARSGAVEEDYDGTVMDYQVAVQGISTYGINQARAVSVVCFLKDGDGAVCVVCGYDYGDYFPSIDLGGVEVGDGPEKSKPKKMPHKPLLTKCLHLFCPGCYKKTVHREIPKKMKETAGRGCYCGAVLRLPTDAVEVSPPDSADVEVADPPKRAARRKYVRPPGEKPNLSTKMTYLHDQLLAMSKKNPNSPHYDMFSVAVDVEELDEHGRPYVTKSVVFSQWTTMLDRIGDMLDVANIKFARLDGTMTREDRAAAVIALNTDVKTEVLLVSTRAGGVGLNLTAASRCYLVDPYWNPSVEAQAIDRIHRMGQKRPVTAIKLMINDSIEKKLDEIQQKKANLAQLSLKNMSRKELLAQKAEELASLFR